MRVFKTIFEAIYEAWYYLDGHKTNIGTFLTTVYTYLILLDVVKYNENVFIAFGLIFGVGVVDKGRKYIKNSLV